ncbi:hypothetical protein BDQ17DRAFT_1429303 [Cyathus striatus]|nr:hypothetical protein BDQ17DRAFT_1429303 [Cyathus striatus]
MRNTRLSKRLGLERGTRGRLTIHVQKERAAVGSTEVVKMKAKDKGKKAESEDELMARMKRMMEEADEEQRSPNLLMGMGLLLLTWTLTRMVSAQQMKTIVGLSTLMLTLISADKDDEEEVEEFTVWYGF